MQKGRSAAINSYPPTKEGAYGIAIGDGFDPRPPLKKIFNTMKRRFVIFGILASLLPTASCRQLILEDRSECPSFLFFDITNADLFETSDRVFATVYRQPDGVFAGAETTSVGAIEDKTFWFELKKAESWSGYGFIGINKSHEINDADWVLDEGENGDKLFRYNYTVAGFIENCVVPVEMCKDHANVKLKFLRFDQFEASGGQFPFEVIIRGNTCGINGKTGLPIRGPYMYKPEEEFGGTFSFVLPRQADHMLTLELWAKPGLYYKEGHVDTFSLSAMLQQLGNVDWEAKNLPDIYLEVDYVESTYRIEVMDWEETNELHFTN